MDHLEEFAADKNRYNWKDILLGIIFFPVILPLFLINRLYNKQQGSIN